MSRNLKKYMMEPEAMQYKKGGFIPAEVEGGEKLVADDGVVVKHFKGKSHAKGGIKTMLPVGHYVISKHDLDGDGHSDAKMWNYKTDMERRAYLKALDERPDGERKVDVKGVLRRRFLSGGDVTLGDVNTKAKHARNLKIASGVLGTAAAAVNAVPIFGQIASLVLGAASAGTGIAGTVMSNKANEAGLTLEEQEQKREEELRKKNIDESNTIRQQVNQNPYLVSKYGSSTNNYFKRYAFGKSPYDTGAESPISGNGADGNFMQKFGDFAGGYGNVISTGISAAGQIGGSIANSVFANRAAEEQALKDAQTHNDRMAAIDKNTKYANYMKNNINTNPFVLREDGGKINSKDISYFQNGDPTGKKKGLPDPNVELNNAIWNDNRLTEKNMLQNELLPETPKQSEYFEGVLRDNLTPKKPLYTAPNSSYYKASEMKPSAEPSPVNTTLGINSDRLRKNIMDRYLNTQTIGSLGREVSGLIQAFEPNTPQYQPPVPVQPHMQQDFTEANRANAIRDIMRGYRTSNAMSTPTIDRQQANAEQLQKFDSLLGAQQQINNQALQTKQAIQGANTEQINRYLDTINAQNREASMLNWNRGVTGDAARMDAVQRTLEAAQQQRGDIEANRTQAYLNLVDAPEKRAIDDIETEMRMVQVNPDLTPEVKEMKYRELLERKNQLLSGRFNNNNLFKRYYGQGI